MANVVEDVEKLEPSYIADQTLIIAAALEKSLLISQKVKHNYDTIQQFYC